MKSSIFLVFIWSISGCLAQPAEKNRPPEDAEFDFRPSAKPDRIALTWTDTPHTTQTITWRTDTTVKLAYAEFVEASADPDFHRSAKKINASISLLKNEFASAVYHQATLTDLKSDSEYSYRVGGGDSWSEWYTFSTTAEEFIPFSFIYLGDAQNKLYSHWTRVIRAAHQKAPDAKFVLHAGDLINHSQNDYEWGSWFRGGDYKNRTVPMIVTPGNHEYIKDESGTKLGISPFWDVQFNFPKNGPAELEDQCYYMDIQGVRVISLNSNEQLEVQATWLEKVLSNSSNAWTIVTFHHPVVSAAKGRTNEGVLKCWKPILDKYKVDLVLQGHDHSYARGQNLVTGTNSYESTSGTTYVVSVSGAKMYDLFRQAWMQRSGENLQFYQIIDLKADRLTYKAYTADNQLYDAFELVKQPGEANKLVELSLKE